VVFSVVLRENGHSEVHCEDGAGYMSYFLA